MKKLKIVSIPLDRVFVVTAFLVKNNLLAKSQSP